MVDRCWPVDSQNLSGSFQEGFPATILGATSSTSTTFAVFGSKLHHSSNGGEEVELFPLCLHGKLMQKYFRCFQASLISVIYGESLQVQLWVAFRFHCCTFSITSLPGSLDAALKSKTAVFRRLVVGIVYVQGPWGPRCPANWTLCKLFLTPNLPPKLLKLQVCLIQMVRFVKIYHWQLMR